MTARGFPAFPPSRGPGSFAKSWWGRAWVKAVEDTALDEGQLRQGRKYARTGYVGAITVSPGLLSATVRDYEDDTSYQTLVRLEPLSDTEWTRFLGQVGAQAGHIAALLDGDMPADLVDAAADAGVRLLPEIGDLDPECPCPGWELPCRHAAALSYQAAWLLDADPFILLLLRGKGQQELLAALHGLSSPDTPGTPAAAAFAQPPHPLPAPPPSVPAAEGADPLPGSPDPIGVALSVPAAEGIDPAALELLATDAATRARQWLTGDITDLPRWPDTVRYAATYPATTDRLRQRHPTLDRAVAAWHTGGWAALEVLETPWTPPRADLARAHDALTNSWEDAPPEITTWRNHWTIGEVQLRYGKDGRWYPYRTSSGEWWPAGPPQRDIASALLSVLS
ncbi:SWIM zinc finger family protein [Actinokineospora iranica]|uniref:Uncharacterized conserved protein, contains Zn finger domain n=1 Tax=Actinokineospora iranica TaxID=1271860 RepID=A0A1G6J6I0_9PSEU|nr:hypothetical protein [Actinokineospora iranica]SDC13556.1 Uncharacterized conserved protein, contains Zn finger domain [Actinokineospora iranica]